MKQKWEEDKKLAKRILGGERRAFRQFYRLWKPKLSAYVVSRVKSCEDAEEIVQDSFLSFLDSLPLFSFRSSLGTFLVAIARHEVADYYRRLYAKRAIRCVPFVDQVYTSPMYSARETREEFERALARIEPRERRLLLWKYEEKLSVKEMARKLGVSVKAVESRLFRARKAFGVAYEKAG